MQEIGLLVVVALVYLFFTTASRHLPSPGQWNPFLNLDNQINGISRKLSVYAIMAVGMTFVIITGGIDISVGAILAMSELSTGLVLQKMPLDSPWYVVLPVAFLVSMSVGALCGSLNGFIKSAFRMHPFIVTLATLSMFNGLCVLCFPPSLPQPRMYYPKVFGNFMRYDMNRDLEIVPAIIMLVVVALGAIYLQMMVAGRETYAAGGNAEAARFSGIRVWWVTARVYIIMGVCCGIAAVVEMGRFGSTQTGAGSGYELKVIASAVVGGAALTGGRGTAFGAMLGTLVIAALENGILTMQWDTHYTNIIVGASIVIAVSVDRISDHLIQKRTRSRVTHA